MSDDEIQKDQESPEENPLENTNDPFGESKTALIVEDEPATIEILRKLLTERGFEVLQAENGKAAWNKLHSGFNKPNIIISDFLMPEMDGFQFYKGLKNEDDTKNIPVIFLSARKNMGDSLLAAGADAFLSKPINAELFLQTVKKISLRKPVKEETPEEPAFEKTEEKKE